MPENDERESAKPRKAAPAPKPAPDPEPEPTDEPLRAGGYVNRDDGRGWVIEEE